MVDDPFPFILKIIAEPPFYIEKLREAGYQGEYPTLDYFLGSTHDGENIGWSGGRGNVSGKSS